MLSFKPLPTLALAFLLSLNHRAQAVNSDVHKGMLMPIRLILVRKLTDITSPRLYSQLPRLLLPDQINQVLRNPADLPRDGDIRSGRFLQEHRRQLQIRPQ